MTTRYTADPQRRFDLFSGLPTGYQGKPAPDVVVPAVGIEDVDRALFKLFNEEIRFIVSGNGVDQKRVPVVFFAGEKWALNKRLKALKDRNNTLILPLITAVRTTLTQDPALDITGRGINQQTGEIVINRRLDKSDRAYQGLINRLMLRNQANLAVTPSEVEPGQLSTLGEIGDLEDDPTVQQGGLLLPNRQKNVYETIVIPAPQFFTAKYDVTLWSQYTGHMNQMLEAMISSFLPQGNSWRLDTPQGYWFMASVDGNQYTADTNTDDYSQEERLIRYKLVINVPGYILASGTPGAPVPVRRYISSPTISFQVSTGGSESIGNDSIDDPFLGADDPTLPLTSGDDGPNTRSDQRMINRTRLYPDSQEINPEDPALRSYPRGTHPARYKKVTGIDGRGKKVVRLVRVRNINGSTGETVLVPDQDLLGLTIVLVED
jgi:hypothetical protein